MDTLQPILDGLPDHGDRPALVAVDGGDGAGQTWTYARLDAHVRQLAAGLRADGVERGEMVAVIAPNSPQWMIAGLAVIGCGATVVPIDVQFDDDVLAGVLDDSGVRRVFTTAEGAARLGRLELERPLHVILLDDDRNDADRNDADRDGTGQDDRQHWRQLLDEVADDGDGALVAVAPEDVAALFYTSGTTGPPKGVPLTHGNLAFSIDAFIEVGLVGPDDRVLLPLPLHHVYAFAVGMLGPLAMGLPIVLPGALTGPAMAEALEAGRTTVLLGVPRLYEALVAGLEARAESHRRLAAALLDVGWSASTWLSRRLGWPVGRWLLTPVRTRLAPDLRLVASGGSALDPALAWRLKGLGWDVATGYGLTETAPILAWNLPADGRIGTVGRPVPGVELRIERQGDDDADVGEIQARGPNVFDGYWQRPQKTAAAFTEDGWFRTGDRGYFDGDGYLHITGRVSTLIITPSGEKVQPQAVEAAYAEHAALREVGVLERDGRLVALVVPEPEALADDEDRSAGEIVGQALDEQAPQLPSYMRVSDVAVTRQALPRTRLGKIKRHALDERYETARSDGVRGEPVAPSEMSGRDRALLDQPAARQTWELLARRYPDRRLTPDTRMQLELGVDSLGWVDLTLAIRERTGVALDEAAVARVATVRDLLREVIDAANAGDEAAAVDPVSDPHAVLSDEQRRWLEPLGPVQRAVAHALFALNRVLMRAVFRLEVRGADRLPSDAQLVLAPNHESFLDAFALAAAIDWGRMRASYWGGWRGIAFGNPITRRLSRLAQGVPLDPHAGFISSLAFGAAVLEQGSGLVWFPEGRRSETGELQEFRPGLGRLLAAHPVPVVPVRVIGAYEALPPGQRVPHLRPITVVFGAPCDPETLEAAGDGDTAAERITDALRERVAALGDDA